MEEHVIGDNSRYTSLSGHISEFEQAQLIVGPSSQRQRYIRSVAKAFAHASEPQTAKIIGNVWNEDADQSFAIESNIIPFELTFTFTDPSGTSLATGAAR